MRWLLLFILTASLFADDYTIGRDPSYYPYNFKEKTEYVNGYFNQLFEEIGKKENVAFEIVDAGTVALLSGLAQKEYDGALSVALLTSKNLDRYAFSTSLLDLGPVLVVPKQSKAKHLSDFEGGIVGISPFNNSVFIAQKYRTLIIRPYMSLTLALESLARGEIDLVLLPALGAHELINNRFSQTLKIVSPPLNHDAVRLITLKEEKKTLIKLINKTVKAFKSNSHLKEMQMKFCIY
ncbi:MAG: transporter substrate-binding domain-containing protein [Chlamydiia bacterium]|nr:transporter substrate-binding domain-containing protein [Chlamydiia bacterium]